LVKGEESSSLNFLRLLERGEACGEGRGRNDIRKFPGKGCRGHSIGELRQKNQTPTESLKLGGKKEE